MPNDPKPHPAHSPEALAARREMDRTLFEEGPSFRAAAGRLLRLILGSGGPAGATPPPRWWDWPFTPPGPGYRTALGGGLFVPEDLDPRIEAAYNVAARGYPQAASHVYGLYGLPDWPRDQDPEGRLGEYTGLGGVGLRTQFDGKDIPFDEMIATAKHELAHAQGLRDFAPDPETEIDAYDITSAARHRDIRLPPEGPFDPTLPASRRLSRAARRLPLLATRPPVR